MQVLGRAALKRNKRENYICKQNVPGKIQLVLSQSLQSSSWQCLCRAATKHSWTEGSELLLFCLDHVALPWSYPAPSPSSKQKEEDTEYLSQHRFNFLGSYKITKSDGLAVRARHLVRWNVRQIFPLIDTDTKQSVSTAGCRVFSR